MTTKKPSKTNRLKQPKHHETAFLVYSYCDDQWQTFVDLLMARSEKEAEYKVKRFRHYAIVDTDATTTVSDHLEFAIKMSKKSPAQVRESWEHLKKHAH